MNDGSERVQELDVRSVRKPERHPLIFARFAALDVGESFVLVNSHDPKHLREEFERDHPDAFGWEYVKSGPDVWQVRIRKSSSPLPEALCDAIALAGGQSDDFMGAIWRLETSERQLDANIIRVRAHDRIEFHTEARLDVLLYVLSGDGEITSGDCTQTLQAGGLLWLPRGSNRQISAGSSGLSYLTVHLRRPGLSIDPVSTGRDS